MTARMPPTLALILAFKELYATPAGIVRKAAELFN